MSHEKKEKEETSKKRKRDLDSPQKARQRLPLQPMAYRTHSAKNEALVELVV